MRTPSTAGSPITTLASRAASALITSSSMPRGTRVRRMAVHFCPAFVVISRTTSLMNRSNSSVPGAASGPSTEQLSESASMLNRTAFSTTAGVSLSMRPVAADPVNATASWHPRCDSRSPALPQMSCSAPSGRMPAATISRTIASVRYEVTVAGLTMAGTPARNVGASFSSIPQQGKLKALMCTATPSSGTHRWRPANVPPLDSGSIGPST